MFRIYDKDMNLIKYPDGVKPLDIEISAIEKERNTESLEGVPGNIDFGADYKERDIKLNLLMIAHDTQDYRLLRDKVYAIFDDVEYVSEDYEPGKRYKVRVDAKYAPERIKNNQRYAKVEIECAMPGIPFAESIGTTQDIEKHGIDADSKLWAFGMGLKADDDTLKYTHTGTSFKVFNAGNVSVHPFYQELKITISDVKGSSDKFELKNTTTGDTFKITEGVKNSKTIKLDGPNITNNDKQYLRKTNKQFITLKPDWNEFKISGADRAEVKFDFRFYYK